MNFNCAKILQCSIIYYMGLWQPPASMNESLHSEFLGHFRSNIKPDTRPSHSSICQWSSSKIFKLCIENTTHIRLPLCPSRWIQESSDVRLHYYCSCIVSPGPSKICGSCEVVKRIHSTPLDWHACILIWVRFALSSDGIELAWHWLPWLYATVLENHCCISKDEVYRPSDLATSVELAIWMCVECVLKCVEGATIEDGLIWRRS